MNGSLNRNCEAVTVQYQVNPENQIVLVMENDTARRYVRGIMKRSTLKGSAVIALWLCANAPVSAATSADINTVTTLALGTVISVTVLVLFACLILRNRLPVMTAAFGIPCSVLVALSAWPTATPVVTSLRHLALLVLCVIAIELTLSLRRLRVRNAFEMVARTAEGVAGALAIAVIAKSTTLNVLPALISGFSLTVFVVLAVCASFIGLKSKRYALFVAIAWTVLAVGIALSVVSEAATWLTTFSEVAAAAPGFDAVLALSLVLLALGLMHQTMRLHTRWANELAVSKKSDHMLIALERSQREFSREVDNFLGTVSANDFEEVVLSSFLLHLDRVIPAAASAVAVSHRGQMRLVSRFPKGNNRSFSSLLNTREDLLQSICLSDKAAVLHSDKNDLHVDNEPLSTLCVIPVPAYRNEWAGVILARIGEQDFQLEELMLVRQFAEHVKTSFESANKFNRFRRQAETDMLTGLLNRRAISVRADRAFKKARSLKNPLSFLFIDIDNFKAVNDSYGHEVGDRALHRVAQICQSSVRDEDKVGRFGGEEFIAILPGTGEKNANFVAERIRKSIAESPLNVDGEILTLTVSVGISEYHPRFEATRDMLNAADRALFAAKRDGRNRVVHHLRIVRSGSDS